MSRLRRPLVWLVLLLVGPHLMMAAAVFGEGVTHWSQARWDSAGLAPDPAATPRAVVQVYAARAFGWKGVFAVHSWIVFKRPGASRFERFEVVGWGVGRGAPAIRRSARAPDGYWAGNRPAVLLDRRGAAAAALIAPIEAAIASYPYRHAYLTWPGPNSNTFIAWIARAVPALGLELPPTAVGKDFLGARRLVAATPSGTGGQVSLFGVLGVALARAEGLEVHILGLTFGIDPLGLAIKLPGIGRLGGSAAPGNSADVVEDAHR